MLQLRALRAQRGACRRATMLLLALFVALPGTLVAQNRIEVKIAQPTLTAPATVAMTGLLADKAFDKLMRGGFSVRVHFKAELWRSRRFLDEISAESEWDMIVRFDAFDKTYEVARIVGDSIVVMGPYRKLEDAQLVAERPYAMALPKPPRGRESYINVLADIQAMDITDLDELMGWLRGEARPAVQGKKNPTTVVGGALRSIGSRLLGAEVRHVEQRTRAFKL
ncbi:MAG: hypothetical protein ACO1Q7_17315 [Gemmatimonas sp.]